VMMVSCSMSLLWPSEDDCGSPPALPHAHVLWNKSSRVGTNVVYQCNSGYHNVGTGNVSICTSTGQWERPPMLCQGTVIVLSDHFQFNSVYLIQPNITNYEFASEGFTICTHTTSLWSTYNITVKHTYLKHTHIQCVLLCVCSLS